MCFLNDLYGRDLGQKFEGLSLVQRRILLAAPVARMDFPPAALLDQNFISDTAHYYVPRRAESLLKGIRSLGLLSIAS
jgi:hypothetical protein